MYGDTSAIRQQADRMRQRADDIRDEAFELAARAEAVRWSGLAADAMRRAANGHAARMRDCAEAHEAAADALLHHAREVEHVQLVIASIEHRAHRLLESAAHGVAELAGFARHFVPPPPGNHAWLDVDLPHLPHLPRPR